MKKFNNATQTYTLQYHCHNRLCHTVHWIGTVCTGCASGALFNIIPFAQLQEKPLNLYRLIYPSFIQ